MKIKALKLLATISISSSLLAFSSGALAYDWEWALDDIANSNFGQSAGWIIESVVVVGGDEYFVEDAVCKDYEVTVEKHRFANPAGRGKFKEITSVETETFCQPLVEEV